MKYLENRHVISPLLSKPLGAGIVHIFATLLLDEKEILTDILQWTTDGKGGDRRGKLLTA